MGDTKQITISASHQSIDELVLSQLEEFKDDLEKTLSARINGGPSVFEDEKSADIMKIKEHIHYVKNVISWYSV